MSQNEVKGIVDEYVNALKQSNLPLWRVYLFGSYAKNTANKNSDIDVAVVIEGQRSTTSRDALLWSTVEKVNWKIEPHLFLRKHFIASDNTLAIEVKKFGWRAY